MSTDAYIHLLKQSKNYSTDLNELISKIGPISIPRRKNTDLLKFLCRLVIGQQLSVSVASKIWERAVSVTNDLNLDDTEIFYSKCYESELKNCGISGNKIKAMYSIASFLKQKPDIEAKMKKYSHRQRREVLTEIYGVGEWTADMTSLFFYKDADIWPMSDVSIRKSYSKIKSTSKKINLDDMENAVKYTPYRSYLALYLWKGLDSGFI